MRRSLICSLFCILFVFSNAQSFPNPYPQGYFRWPVNLRPEIVANMGELRPNHWHMGLDVRTGGHENEPVYAAADGYISYIGIRPSSFGRFLIINHPNGLSTLYAHLNEFAPAIEQWVTAQQYSSGSWTQEIRTDSSLFPVRKGDFISYSGNTGGSQGPHVHFEIRSTQTDECLNPLLFGFDLTDQQPPVLQQLAIYDRSQSIYSAGRPQAFTLKSTDSGYIIPRVPVVKISNPVIGLGLRAYDRLNGSTNRDGIYSAMVWMDDEFVTGFILDSINYDETRYYNAHVDYRNHYKGGVEYQLLSPLPNDQSGVYRNKGDGLIRLTDTLVHSVYMEVMDAAGNRSLFNFRIRFNPGPEKPTPQVDEQFIPGQAKTLTRGGFELELYKDNLYDTVNVYYNNIRAIPGAVSGSYTVNDESIPLHGTLKVSIRPEIIIAEEQRDRMVIKRKGGRSDEIRKAEWENDRVTANLGDFGTFTAYADNLPPVIKAPGTGDTIDLSRSSRLLFTPTDASGIKNFKALVDGEWIRFTNDKGRTWIYRFDERVPYGVHELMVQVEDIAGNITEKTWWFRRNPYTPPPPRKKISKKSKSKKTAAKKPVKKKRK
ncbi:MAG: peptidoglycan DD-metalloendopeptidase family protein [Chitinophagaceae bacterium]